MLHFRLKLSQKSSRLTGSFRVVEECAHNLEEGRASLLVQLGHSNSGCKLAIVGVQNVEVSSSLGQQVVELRSLDA